MATAAQVVPQWPRALTWLRDFLREELAPYPGRGALIARMMVAVTIVVILNMTFRIPYGAYGAVYALTISRENPDATLKAVRTILIWFTIGVADVLLGAILFSSEPVLRLAWVLFTLFIMFYALSALSNYSAAARFGYLVVITIPIWDAHISANLKVENTLWAVAGVSLASVVTAAVELIAARLKPTDDLTDSVAQRLDSVASLLRSLLASAPDPRIEQLVIRQSILGTSLMRRDLLRSGFAPDYAERMGAVIAFVGRLIDIAANFIHFPAQSISPADRTRIEQLVENLDSMRTDLLNHRIPELVHPIAESAAPDSIPLLREMERTVSLIAQAFAGSRSLGAFARHNERAEPPGRIFVPDAFTNRDHIRFAIRGSLAAAVCYLAYNLADWPEISTAVTTCLLTALTTVGSSRQKQALRFSGAIVGGAICIGGQVFILPALDSITGFLLFFLAVSIFAAWFATSGPRLSYFGVQVATTFYLVNLQEFKFQTSLSVAWDRIAGVFIGLLAMWLIFDQLWSVSASTEMRRTFISSLRFLAQLTREPTSPDIDAAIERTYSLRNSISSSFEKVRQHGDGVMLEFGPSRDRDLALRSQLLDWQMQLRGIFIARVTLLKYRLNLPGFELPASIQPAKKSFDDEIARLIDSMADSLEGEFQAASPTGGEASIAQRDESAQHALEQAIEGAYDRLQQSVKDCCPDDPPEELAAKLRTFLPLCQRLESLTLTLATQI
jgi:multidrug resistance protein MdtO